MIIVDTSVWVDYLRGTLAPHTDWLHAEMERQPLGLTDWILCEVLQGTRNARDFARVRRALSAFTIYPTGGTALAIAAARHYHFLRARGRTVRRTADCLIGAFCLQEGHALLHNDRDFDAFEALLGLPVVHPEG